ncbi:hypothetical protein [Brevibacterium sp. ZH18]|uniref:hypothetical protein n=1 Tax=Brevibacterium sp. ZH18 TaxID=2927784 RepID=UPI001F620C54|nr:hypothetical protein [Brevibacterium sp. ZH18]MCI4011043.1 hypothetical protein [Brevibacterium sp. ZH18]
MVGQQNYAMTFETGTVTKRIRRSTLIATAVLSVVLLAAGPQLPGRRDRGERAADLP